jgi:hypothetical protein
LLHVPNGPGVIAVGLEADLALDHTDGVWGALFRRKNTLPGGTDDRLRDALSYAALIALRLTAALPGGLKFDRTSVDLVVNDRALAPNTPETYAAALPEIEIALRAILGHSEFRMTRHDRDPRRRFGVTLFSARPFDLAALAGSAGQPVSHERAPSSA